MNAVAASFLFSGPTRRRLYVQAGLDIETTDIGPGCYFHTAQVQIAPSTTINRDCLFENTARITIGAGTALGIGCRLVTQTHRLGGSDRRAGQFQWLPIKIGEGCWIGAQTLVLPGVRIGSGCMVAAGSVVQRDCEPNGLYAGTPAIRKRDLPLEPVDAS